MATLRPHHAERDGYLEELPCRGNNAGVRHEIPTPRLDPRAPVAHHDSLSANRGGRAVRDVLTMILAGGKGTRLEPLTRDRAKPAVPFGGLYRIIDFTLPNCINSDLRRILVLTQYKARNLDRHIAMGWSFPRRQLNESIE